MGLVRRRQFAEKWIAPVANDTEICNNMKHLYKTLLFFAATYALSALALWSHG